MLSPDLLTMTMQSIQPYTSAHCCLFYVIGIRFGNKQVSHEAVDKHGAASYLPGTKLLQIAPATTSRPVLGQPNCVSDSTAALLRESLTGPLQNM